MLQHCPMKHNSFLRPLKKKGFKEERVTTIGLYEMGKSHDPGIQQEPREEHLGRAQSGGSGDTRVAGHGEGLPGGGRERGVVRASLQTASVVWLDVPDLGL